LAPRMKPAARSTVTTALGLTQILAWGSSYYLPAVLAKPIAESTGWSLEWVVGGLSFGLLVQGLVSPAVGRAIDHHGGRPVLAISALLLALGLATLAISSGLPLYFVGWTVIGLGMGAGLYDAAFSTLGKLYGVDARQAITVLTLFGGFASTVCWPLSAYLTAEFGWRGTCLVYAALHLGLALPIYWFVLPRENWSPSDALTRASAFPSPGERRDPGGNALFYLLATALTLCSIIAAVVSVHLLTLLQARGLSCPAHCSEQARAALIFPARKWDKL
jgi:MFS family permease